MYNGRNMQPSSAAWVGLRRPLLVAAFLGCAISLMDSGRLSLRLALPAAVYWTFVPVLEIASLFAVSAAARRALPWHETVDRFFQGHGPWLLWIAGFSAYWAFLPTVTAYSWLFKYRLFEGSAFAVLVWSAYVDFRFFRRELKLSAGRACRDLLLQRLLSWSVGLALFVAPAGVQVLASSLGL